MRSADAHDRVIETWVVQARPIVHARRAVTLSPPPPIVLAPLQTVACGPGMSRTTPIRCRRRRQRSSSASSAHARRVRAPRVRRLSVLVAARDAARRSPTSSRRRSSRSVASSSSRLDVLLARPVASLAEARARVPRRSTRAGRTSCRRVIAARCARSRRSERSRRAAAVRRSSTRSRAARDEARSISPRSCAGIGALVTDVGRRGADVRRAPRRCCSRAIVELAPRRSRCRPATDERTNIDLAAIVADLARARRPVVRARAARWSARRRCALARRSAASIATTSSGSSRSAIRRSRYRSTIRRKAAAARAANERASDVADAARRRRRCRHRSTTRRCAASASGRASSGASSDLPRSPVGDVRVAGRCRRRARRHSRTRGLRRAIAPRS